MKLAKKNEAIKLRLNGGSINDIAKSLEVAKSSVSIWVRDIELSGTQLERLNLRGHSMATIEKRRLSRLRNEQTKRDRLIHQATKEVSRIDERQLWLIGIMLYWAEGGKTQRMVRFSNGDPKMIAVMMKFFRVVCKVPEAKFKGYIHIHESLDACASEKYWSGVTSIPVEQFFKTYKKPNKSSKSLKTNLPYGVFDIYVLDSKLFLQIMGWIEGVAKNTVN